MKVAAGSAIFDALPESRKFASPFPSEDTLFDSQLQSLLAHVPAGKIASVGQGLVAAAGAQAWRDAQALCNFKILTEAGDFPADRLPDIAWLKSTAYGPVVEGLFAAVAFPSLENSLKFAATIANIGLEQALKALSAVPIAGFIASAVISFGRALVQAFTAADVPVGERRYQLPWTRYVQASDQDLVNDFLIRRCEEVDWTDSFAPPTDVNTPWLLTDGVNEQMQVIGKIFAPAKIVNGQASVAWNGAGLGVIPGTLRVAGLIQTRPTHSPGNKLARYFLSNATIPWAPGLTQTGDFRPALAQAGGQLWQQAQKAGSPDMYKIDTRALDTAWAGWFEGFFEAVWQLAAGDEWLGDLAAPYIAVERGSSVRLGLPWRARPQPAPMIWPGIFESGPARPAARTPCLFAEIETKKKIIAGESPDTFWWPWRTEPEQSSWAPDYKVVDGHLAADGSAVAPGQMRKTWRCYGWPSGEEMLSKYARPFESIVRPALESLRALQFSALRKTLVCASVRPENSAAGPRYAAFNDPQLRASCLALREQLLASEDRFVVSYQDVKLIDPEYAEALRLTGIPTTEIARQAIMKKRKADHKLPNGQVDPVAPPLPPPAPPRGGVAFGGDGRVGRGGGGGGAALLGGAAALALFLRMRGRA